MLSFYDDVRFDLASRANVGWIHKNTKNTIDSPDASKYMREMTEFAAVRNYDPGELAQSRALTKFRIWQKETT